MDTLNVTRRRALQLIAAPALLSLTPAHAASRVKVGLLLTMSGPFASSGEIMANAAKLYLKTQAPKILGEHSIELVIRDDGGANPETAKRLVQELVTRDRVQYLGGFQWTPNANAIAPLMNQAKIPCVLMNAAGAHTTSMSQYFVRTSFTQFQLDVPLGQWAAGTKGYKKGYVLVTDYVPGHEAEQAFVRGFTEKGGTIVDSVRMPIQSPNFVPFLQRVRDTKPDVLFAFHPGGVQALAFMSAYAEVGLKAAGVQLIGPGDLTSDEELPSLGNLALGTITASHYSYAAERPANAAFVSAWRDEYGPNLRPNYMAVGVWDGMHAICSAIAATNGRADSEAALAALKTFRSDASPRGPIAIDPATRHVVQNVYIREVRPVQGGVANVEFQTFENVNGEGASRPAS
jgi:branched-chain amino acid transport system substrate-binding protein